MNRCRYLRDERPVVLRHEELVGGRHRRVRGLQSAGDAHAAHVVGDGGRVSGLGGRPSRRRMPPAKAAAKEPLDHGGEAHGKAESEVLLEVGAEILAVKVVQHLKTGHTKY